MFQLNENEFEFLRSQIATSKTETRGGRQYLPYVFTEQGVAMLSAILKSDTAVQTNRESFSKDRFSMLMQNSSLLSPRLKMRLF